MRTTACRDYESEACPTSSWVERVSTESVLPPNVDEAICPDALFLANVALAIAWNRRRGLLSCGEAVRGRARRVG
jgi:hypothetical protein